MSQQNILRTNTGEFPIDGRHICFHCGEMCPDESISIDAKFFCCQGCKMVFEILHAHDLTKYYQIDKNPGINRRQQGKTQYSWLDDPEVIARLADFADDNLIKLTLRLPQIHCSSCIWLLENLYRLLPGVMQSKVNFLKKEAYINIDPAQVRVRQVVEMLASIGYAPDLNYDSIDIDRQEASTDKTMYYQLGVAGFAFGNIMLLSFPEYLGLSEGVFKQWFGYFSILLSIPVVFYSGKPYLLSAWHGLRKAYLNIDVPISLGIVALFVRSIYEIFSHTGAGYLDSLAGLVFFLLIGKWFQQKTYHRLSFERDYRSYFPVSANILRDNHEDAVAIDKIEPGDTLVVRNQELIPADGMLLRGNAMIDYSFVTGESEPVEKNKGERIYAGGRQVGDSIEVTVIRKVSNSYLTQLWNDSAFSKEDNGSNTSMLADKMGRWFTYVILAIASVVLLYWLPKDTSLAFNAFTAVLIVACPCAVALSVPFTLGNMIRIFGRKGFYLKNTAVIEHLARANTVVLDKTGTITQAGKSIIDFSGEPFTPSEAEQIRTLTARSSHPISRQIRNFLNTEGSNGLTTIEVPDYREDPGLGIQGTISGTHIELRKGVTGGTDVFIDGALRGTFHIRHQYREGLTAMLNAWKDDYEIFLISGDNDQERKTLESQLPAGHLFFNQSPKDKLDFVSNLMNREPREDVIMVGDGLNDAGALQKSDVGIVIAENTNNFTPACDAILDAAQFHLLPDFIRLSQKSLNIVYGAYALAIAYNIIGLSYAAQGTLSPVIAAILMPLSSITIVLFGVGLSSYVSRRLRR